MKRLFLIPILLALFAVPGYADTVNAADCEAATAQAAIDSLPAGNGHIINVPAGTCTWTTQVTIPASKGISILGDGAGSTIITDGVASVPMLVVTHDGTKFFRFSGFTVDHDLRAKGGQGTIEIWWTDDSSTTFGDFRIDNNVFLNGNERSITPEGRGYNMTGLIDNNEFYAPVENAYQASNPTGQATYPSNNDQPQMDRDYDPGTKNFIFFEDNSTCYSFPNDGGVEGYGGARYVYRFNAIHNHTQGHHGADSGSYRGTQVFEIYGNTGDLLGQDAGSPNPARSFLLRSGVGVIFNNTITGYGNMHIQNYRSDPGWVFNWLDLCDGTQPHDENQPGGEGYACIDQVGHLFNDVMDGSNILEPLYVWSNRKNGALHSIAPKHTTGDGTRLYTLHMIENREFYNEDLSFDGTTGVGVGDIGDIPGTCTEGVGYWAEDEGEWNSTNGATPDGRLYVCIAPNTWELRYTPAPYPHPLRTEGGDITPPTVEVTAPSQQAVVTGASVSFTADAADAVGVVGVQFYVDGQAEQAEDTSAPYAVTWDSTGVSDGGHLLTARARDAAGNSRLSEEIFVTVSNGGNPAVPGPSRLGR